MTCRSAKRDVDLVVDGRRVADVLVADTYLRRLRGMLGRRVLPEALVLVPGGAVHGVGMTRSLDVAMLAPEGAGAGAGAASDTFVVVRTAVLRPFGLVLAPRGVRRVLEAPTGSFERWDLCPGARVRFEPVDV